MWTSTKWTDHGRGASGHRNACLHPKRWERGSSLYSSCHVTSSSLFQTFPPKQGAWLTTPICNVHISKQQQKSHSELGGGVYWEDHFPQTWKDSVPSRQEELGRQWCTSSLIRLWTKGRNTISEKFWLKLLEWVKTPGEEVQETRQAE